MLKGNRSLRISSSQHSKKKQRNQRSYGNDGRVVFKFLLLLLLLLLLLSLKLLNVRSAHVLEGPRADRDETDAERDRVAGQEHGPQPSRRQRPQERAKAAELNDGPMDGWMDG